MGAEYVGKGGSSGHVRIIGSGKGKVRAVEEEEEEEEEDDLEEYE